METALMITEYNDGLQWRETGRQIRKISDFKSLKARQGAVDGAQSIASKSRTGTLTVNESDLS